MESSNSHNAGTGLPQNMYRYTDKESQNDLNQNLLDFGWRQYDPIIARWHVTDPAEQFYNPYLAISGNPISIIDPDGRKGTNPPWADAGNSDLLSADLNGFGGGGSGGGMGRGSLASLNPYDMQQLQLASGTAIMSYTDGNNWNGNWHMSAGTTGSPGRGGGVIFSNTGSGASLAVIQGANTNYGVVNGHVVDLSLTYTTKKDITGFTPLGNNGFWNVEINRQFIDEVHFTSVQQGGGGIVDNTKQAWNHYFNGNGAPVSLGSKTKQALLNSSGFQYRHNRIVTGQTTQLTGSFSVNLTGSVFHIGKTNINYSINCNDKSCVVIYELFVNDGFWDVDFIDEIVQGNWFGLPGHQPDGLGPNLERFGGTPYPYIPSRKTFIFSNPGY